jgi:hypothetical protein
MGGRTYIVIGKNDSYRNQQKSEFIVIVIVVVYRNNDTFGYRKKKYFDENSISINNSTKINTIPRGMKCCTGGCLKVRSLSFPFPKFVFVFPKLNHFLSKKCAQD